MDGVSACRHENVACIGFMRQPNESICATQCSEMSNCLAFEFFVPTVINPVTMSDRQYRGESEAW
jgi:hypothetical protein